MASQRTGELAEAFELLDQRLRGLLSDTATTLGWDAAAGEASAARASRTGSQFTRVAGDLRRAGSAFTGFASAVVWQLERIDTLLATRTRVIGNTVLTPSVTAPWSADPDPTQVQALRTAVAGIDRDIEDCVAELRACDTRAAAALRDVADALRHVAGLAREDDWVTTVSTSSVTRFLAGFGIVESAAIRALLADAALLPSGPEGDRRLRALLAGLSLSDLTTVLEHHPDLAARLTGPLPAGLPQGSAEAALAMLLARRGDYTAKGFVHEMSRFFAGLSPEQARRLALLFPSVVGNLDGAPLADRIAANRIGIVVALDDERHRQAALLAALKDTTFGQIAWEAARRSNSVLDLVADVEDPASALARSQARIGLYENLLYQQVPNPAYAEGRPETVGHQVLVFDPAGDGRIAELWGTVDTHTRHVAVFVPGTTVSLDNVTDYSTRMQLLAKDVPLGRAATIVWVGMDLPDAVANAASPGYAETGGPALRDFMWGLGLPDGVDSTVIGHSYGGAVVGVADREGLEATRVLHVESAGAGRGVFTAEDYDAVAPGRDIDRYTMTAPGDTIVAARVSPEVQQKTGLGHGGDPDKITSFTRLETGRFTDAHGSPGEIVSGAASHSDVLQRNTTSWTNLVEVVTGGQVIPYVAPTTGYDYSVGATLGGWGEVVEKVTPVKRYVYEDPSYPGTEPVDIP